MHNPYIRDLFTEGLGDLFFMKYYRFLKKNVTNHVLQKILISIHVFFYLLFLLIIGFIIFKLSFPL